MNLSQSVIDDLAVTWIGLHRSAAPPHLEHMIEEMRQTGDVDGVANYARLLKAVLAIQPIGPSCVSPPARPDIGQTLRNAREDLSASSS